jgi:hypothetical protein
MENAFAADFQVEGEWTMRLSSKTNKGLMKIMCKGDNWRIESRCFVGTSNDFMLISAATNREFTAMLSVRQAEKPQVVPLRIIGCAYPMDTPDKVSQLLWCFFASGSYLEHMTNNMFPPFHELVLTMSLAPKLLLPAKITRPSGKGQLPEKIEFLNDGFGRSFDLQSHNLVTFPYSDARKTGFVAAKLERLAVTNFHNSLVPLEGKYEAYATLTGPVPVNEFEFVVKTIEPCPPIKQNEWFPNAGITTLVCDFRPLFFGGPTNEPINYTMPTGGFVSYEKALKKQNKAPSSQAVYSTRILVIAGLALPLFVYGVMFLARKRRTR